MGVKKRASAPVLEEQINPVDLEKLPFTKSWPADGGFFLTQPLVLTPSVNGGPSNLGMYRIQRFDKKTTGLHFQIAKGGGFHYHLAESQNRSLPVGIFLGGPPALLLAAISPLPENVPELLFAAFLLGKKLPITHIDEFTLINSCEFALLGRAHPQVRRLEGPFGDHYGYYSLDHEFPVFECQKIYHRKGAIFPATVVGKPRQEDFYLGNFLQRLLLPLIKLTMPTVADFWSYGEAGFHTLSGAIVRDRYAREAMVSAFRILGEGQLALTKCLFVTDQSVNLEDFSSLLTTILERFSPETDLYILSNLSLDTLDYTGPQLNRGSRLVLLGLGEKKRDLPIRLPQSLPSYVRRAKLFCPGTLVLEGEIDNPEILLSDPSFSSFPLLIWVDDVEKAVRSMASFLWTVFTRFDPASDLVAKSTIKHHHICYKLPLFIDARMKPNYPPELFGDKVVQDRVTANWHRYFSKPVAMGDESF